MAAHRTLTLTLTLSLSLALTLTLTLTLSTKLATPKTLHGCPAPALYMFDMITSLTLDLPKVTSPHDSIMGVAFDA